MTARLSGIGRFRWVWCGCALLAAGPPTACSSSPEATEFIGTVRDAVSICDESVPADRIVDGIPAYDQCSASENSAIYSNDGVDTSTTAEGSDWVRTQWSGGYQCTELAHRYLYFRWDVQWIPNGNAGTWCDAEPPSTSGVVQTSTPVHGDVIVFPPGQCGADSVYGHVALVDTVDSATRVTVVEQNRAGRRSTNISCAACFLHVVANDGSSEGSGGSTGTGGAPQETGGAPNPTGGAFPASGGFAPATGGAPGSGGSTTGGVATGGAMTGGMPTGGVATGGVSSGGRAAGGVATGGAKSGTGGVVRATGGASTLPTGGTSSAAGGSVPVAGSAAKTGGTAGTAGGSGATGTDGDATGGSSKQGSGDSGAENTVPSVTDTGDATDDATGCGCRAAGAGGTSTHFAVLVLASMVVLGRRRSARRR